MQLVLFSDKASKFVHLFASVVNMIKFQNFVRIISVTHGICDFNKDIYWN